MYERFWNLRERPFDNTIDERFFFYSKSHQEALVRLLYTISDNKGLMLLTGPPGTGKTLLCQIVRNELAARRYQVATLANPDFEPEDFLRTVLRSFGAPAGAQRKAELTWDMEDLARASNRSDAGCVLIVDEAQGIEDWRTLEEIRLLTNLQERGRHLITTILAGGDGFARRLEKMPQVRRRIGVWFRLEPLDEKESDRYISHRLGVAGCQREIFTEDALHEVHAKAGGVPRRINAICDAALMAGSGSGTGKIDAKIVRDSSADATRML